MKARAARRAARRRTVLAAGAALLCLLVAASAPAAGPGYGEWSAPVNLGPVVNSAAAEIGPALSPDGLSLYLTVNKTGGIGGNDIWVSHRTSTGAAWGAPVNLGAPVNSASSDFVPAFTPDGHWMYFASDRPGGFGLADVYRSYRADVHDDFAWQTPTNLGPGVNGPADDNGVGYFENGGHPQLFFGSGRLGGAARDLFLSSMQADGTWGPASLIPELSSPGTENRPSLRGDGLEIFFYSDRAGSGGNDIWSATRPSVDAPWSTPVNAGPILNTASIEQHPYVSLDGRTLVFASNRPIGSGSGDIYVTTRAAKLTVTAHDQTRLFGQANPSLTYGISGFVGGETASVVSGTAACSTTATPWSPAGTYPISCSAGTLGAPGYVFDSFVAAMLTVSYSRPCLSGVNAGPLRIGAGDAVCITAGGSQTGPVTVAPGGSLDVEGGRVTGPVTALGAAVVRVCGATIVGPLTVSGSTGLVLVGGDAATGPCDPNTVVGPVKVTGNTGGVELNGNSVVGPLRITGNTGTVPPPDIGPVHATANAVTGPVTVQPGVTRGGV